MDELSAGQTPPGTSPLPGEAPAPDPLHAAIAKNVRDDSRRLVRPTRLELVGEEGEPLDSAAAKAVLEGMRRLPEYEDIAYVETPDGGVHAYSSRHLIEQHALLCATVSLNDDVTNIAATVREESRLYPRPTPLEFFGMEPWSMTLAKLEEALRALDTSEQYADVRRVTASNGDEYLYSERFLAREAAQAIAEWESVERARNP